MGAGAAVVGVLLVRGFGPLAIAGACAGPAVLGVFLALVKWLRG